MTSIGTNQPSIRLLDDGDRGVLITPEDQDRFILSVADVVNACGAFTQRKRFEDQLRDLLGFLLQWLQPQRDRIRSAFFTAWNGSVLLCVTQKEVAYDDKLSSELGDLDLEVAQNPGFELVTLEVLLLPAVSKEAEKAFLPMSGPYLTYAK